MRSAGEIGDCSSVVSRFRAVMFDLDDTLFDRGAAFERWARERVPGIAETELRWLAGADDRGRTPRTELFEAIAARFGVRVDPEQFSTELAAYVEPEPGVRALVKRLARTCRVAVVTNGGSAGQRAKLAAVGLDDVVHGVFVSSEIGAAKPGAAIFERALRWSEVEATACLFVGDDPIHDIVPAAALRMATAWRARSAWPEELAPPTYSLHALDELEAIA